MGVVGRLVLAARNLWRALLVVAAVGGVVSVTPALANAATLYASASGPGSAPCTDPSSPCSLPTAITVANGDTGDTINLAAGDYAAPADGYAQLTSDQTWVGAGQGSAGTDLQGQDAMTGALLSVGGTSTVTFEDLQVSGATAGGISVESGTLFVTDDTFFNDTSDHVGGAIDSADGGDGPGGAAVTVTSSSFTDNSGVDGGAIDSGFRAPASLTVTDSTFTDNSGVDGGAIDSGFQAPARLTVTDSTFTGNSGLYGGGIAAANNGTGAESLSVAGSTFSDNIAEDGAALAVDFNSSSPSVSTVSDSTFSDNSDSDYGAAVVNSDAGRGSLSVVASTFSGGGIANGEDSGSGTVTVAGDLFATSCSQLAPGTWVDDGDNAGIDSSCLNGGPGDVTDPSVGSDLGDLADNGGSTQTEQIEAGNPGIGIVTDQSVTDASGDSVQLCPTTDQRGVASRQGDLCDAGAVQGTVVPIGVTGSQSYGSGSPMFSPSAAAPGGYALTGSVSCSSVDGGTAIGAALPVGAHTIDPGSCSGLSLAPSGSDYTLQYSGSDFSVTQANELPVVSGSSSPVVFGSPVQLSASVATAGMGAPPTGLVTFYDGSTYLGSAALNAGSATLPTVSDLPVGSDQITAFYAGNANYQATSSMPWSLLVGRAATSTTVSVSADAISASVSPVSPGVGSPSGTVTFTVDGRSIGTATLTGGAATLPYTTPAGKTHQVAAIYGGDMDFSGSSASTSRNDPLIAATIRSAHPVSRYGWYRTAVTITFHCRTDGAPLSTACPAPVTLSRSGAALSVTRTITALDGGAASVTVSPLNLDLSAPRVSVIGVHSGAVDNAPGPNLRCRSRQSLSGLTGRCRLTISRQTAPTGLDTTVKYTAAVTGRNGRTTTIRGQYTLKRVFVTGVPFSNGRYDLAAGRNYRLDVYSTTQPHYLYAASAGLYPGPHSVPMTGVGHHLWEILIGFGHSPNHTWNLGVEISGHTIRIPVSLS